MKELAVLDLGMCEYQTALALQQDLVDRRARDDTSDVLLLLQHPPVFTMGRGSCAEAPKIDGIAVHAVERGGATTYHGPGQQMAYPILFLEEEERDLHRYLRSLEQGGIDTCRAVGIDAGRNPDHTGIWVGDRKIASIGVAVRKWVTYHGLALNVDGDLGPFRKFSPCGLDGRVITSLEECGVSEEKRVGIPALLMNHLAAALGREIRGHSLNYSEIRGHSLN